MTIAGFPYTRSFRYRVTTTLRPGKPILLRGARTVPGRVTLTIQTRT